MSTPALARLAAALWACAGLIWWLIWATIRPYHY